MNITPIEIIFIICLIVAAFTSRTASRKTVRGLWLTALIVGLGIRIYQMHTRHIESEKSEIERAILGAKIEETVVAQKNLQKNVIPRRLSNDDLHVLFSMLEYQGASNIMRMWDIGGHVFCMPRNTSHARVELRNNFGDLDGLGLCTDILNALEKAEWTAQSSQIASVPPISGMGILINSNAHPHTVESATILQAALKAVNLDMGISISNVVTNYIVVNIGQHLPL